MHLNLAGLPDRDFFLWLRDLAAKYHTTYWTTNVKSTCCNDCGHIDARTLSKCPKCGSGDITRIERMNGYLGYSRVKGRTMYADHKLQEFSERKSM